MALAERPSPNARAHPYGRLSVQHVDRVPDPDFMTGYLMGREVYRQTDYVALVHGEEVGLAAVARADSDDLFVPVVDVAVWSGPEQTMLIEDSTVDCRNATALADAARRNARPGISAYLVKGRYEHVNFIWEPAPIRIHVTEVTPPVPPELLMQAHRAVAFDEDLPPIELVLDAVTFSELAGEAPSDSYLAPVKGANPELQGEVSFLNTRPASRSGWVMIGCERSMQLHRHFYGDDPPQVDICPRKRVEEADPEGLRLVKCCMLEGGTEFVNGRAVVRWGAKVNEVRRALRRLTGVDQVTVAGG